MTVVMDAVATATAAVPRLYELGSVPSGVEYPYGVYSASLGRADTFTLNAEHGVRHGRVVVQTFGRTAESALTWMDDVVEALLDRRLAVPGRECTPLVIELDPSVVRDSDDNGVIGVTATFTFTATKE